MNILVQLAEPVWTKRALHAACTIARDRQCDVILLRLMQVEHISYLNSEFGNTSMTHAEYEALNEYAATAEDYGVGVSLEQTQCLSALDAVADAAIQLDAKVIFAYIPSSPIPLLHELRLHHLERRLRNTGCLLYTLDGQAEVGRLQALKSASAT